jgi:hypothetical protein
MLSKILLNNRVRAVVSKTVAARAFSGSLEGYGKHLFKGAVAAPYLEAAGLPADTLACPAWCTNGNADKVYDAFSERWMQLMDLLST